MSKSGVPVVSQVAAAVGPVIDTTVKYLTAPITAGAAIINGAPVLNAVEGGIAGVTAGSTAALADVGNQISPTVTNKIPGLNQAVNVLNNPLDQGAINQYAIQTSIAGTAGGVAGTAIEYNAAFGTLPTDVAGVGSAGAAAAGSGAVALLQNKATSVLKSLFGGAGNGTSPSALASTSRQAGTNGVTNYGLLSGSTGTYVIVAVALAAGLIIYLKVRK